MSFISREFICLLKHLFHTFIGLFAVELRKAANTGILYVWLTALNSLAPSGRIFVKFLFWGFCVISLYCIKLWLKSDETTLCEDVPKLLINVAEFFRIIKLNTRKENENITSNTVSRTL